MACERNPAGFAESSRWLRPDRAPPPVSFRNSAEDPGRGPRSIATYVRHHRRRSAQVRSIVLASLPGCSEIVILVTGGVASLNHRLLSVTPHGVNAQGEATENRVTCLT